MVSQRELQEVVTQINGILERLDKRLQALESTQTILLHDIKKHMTEKPKQSSRRTKNG